MTEQGRILKMGSRSCGFVSPPEIVLDLRTPSWRLHFPHYISLRWWNKKLVYCSNVSSEIQKKITKFTFKSKCKKTNSKLVNDLAYTSWASQFKYMYCHIGPPSFSS